MKCLQLILSCFTQEDTWLDQGPNLYGCCGSDLVNNTDPSGHCYGFPSVVNWSGIEYVQNMRGPYGQKRRTTALGWDVSPAPGGFIHYIIAEDAGQYCLERAKHKALSGAAGGRVDKPDGGGDGSSISQGYSANPDVVYSIKKSPLSQKEHATVNLFGKPVKSDQYFVYTSMGAVHSGLFGTKEYWITEYYIQFFTKSELETFIRSNYFSQGFLQGIFTLGSDVIPNAPYSDPKYADSAALIGFVSSLANVYYDIYAAPSYDYVVSMLNAPLTGTAIPMCLEITTTHYYTGMFSGKWYHDDPKQYHLRYF